MQDDDGKGMPAKGGQVNDDTYDPYRMPADIKMAELHYECNRFGKPPDLLNKDDVVFCPCCHQTRQEEVPLSVECSKIDFYGPDLRCQCSSSSLSI